MKFTMPFGQTLEIKPSKQMTFEQESNIGHDEEIEGLTWHIFVIQGEMRIELPWFTNTILQASAIALGCQYGAYLYAKTRESP